MKSNVARNRKEWFTAHPCICGLPSIGAVGQPGHPLPKGVWCWGAERRNEALLSALALCPTCWKSWQRARLIALNPNAKPRPAPFHASVEQAGKHGHTPPIPVVVKPARKDVGAIRDISPKVTRARVPKPVDGLGLADEMEANDHRRERAMWREDRRERLGYGL